jgi:hypothetical protein
LLKHKTIEIASLQGATASGNPAEGRDAEDCFVPRNDGRVEISFKETLINPELP